MGDQKKRVYSFGRFRLDEYKRLLFAGDEVVTLTPKAFDTLLALVENRGAVLSKEELMRLVWPDQFVEENNLAQNIHAVRKSLGDGVGGVKHIETIPKRGYRFIAPVEVSDDSPPYGAAGGERRKEAEARERSTDVGENSAHPGLHAPTDKPALLIMPKTQYALSTGGVNIAYQVLGQGPLDLVFVMGWVSHLEYFWREPSFARFLARLASFSRLILFDKRGTGLSDPVPLSDLPTLEQRMTDVNAVMDAVGSERAALLGVSEGGPMCSLFAATYPERTVALVMMGTYAKRVWSEDYPWAPTAEERATFEEEVRKNWGGPVGLRERAPGLVSDPQFCEWWATYLRLGASPGPALALTRMSTGIDIRQILPSIRVPSLVLHRAGDICVSVENGRYVASRIPGAKYVEFDGDNHLPFVGDQDALLDEVEEFLTGARPEHRIERVLVTVMFVLLDAAGSRESGQQDPEVNEVFKTYARHELALFRGKEAEMAEAHLFATFDGPARAIRCALAIADSAQRLGLPVRAGLHTGECDIRGEKMAGVTIDLGEAIARLASAGEVLVSHTVKDLVAGSGIQFEPRSERALESSPGEWRLFAVGRGADR